jgi:glycosyltransferase involved in cell wall biosynthesis
LNLSVGCVTVSYNQASYLRACIDSVDRKDRSQLRHVVVDPGSSDGSRAIIEDYRSRGRFHEVIFEPDRGPADGLNKGFQAIGDADILCYLNSDDEFHPGAIDRVCQYFSEHPEVEVVTGAGVFTHADGRHYRRKRISLPFTPWAFLHDTVFVMQQSTFFRKKVFPGVNPFNVDNRTCWDTELLVDLYIRGVRFTRVPMLFGHFRLYPGCLTYDAMHGGFSPKLMADIKRMKEKFHKAGYRPLPWPLPLLHRSLVSLNPWRRVVEFIVT